ncbi:uroporphyrinogen-III synthase [Rhizobiales bacterium RZME27]|uniref:Uroporphyrinogen-III synthase n=1 Tax=Endobacterium cereale TaxID=2663029 RepID=A0A6A8A9H9_9HYPH|nr:uroporphyrinogen-III synthase [Endobacterium cereale]MEB2847638.1 uroporphyrinogen-III synthase [Endobacterium cereale]MQY47902.1 uroporphyrinogen-III synthase [Endobacterium cereale]
MRVVVTRPLNRAEVTATELRGMGHEPLLLPLSAARHLTNAAARALTKSYPAIALTSAEALRALAGLDLSNHLQTPLFAVGRKTAAAAQNSGFQNIRIADGDGASLAELIVQHAPSGVVYLTGRPRSPTFETALHAAEIPHSVVECYEMVPLQPSPADIRTLLATPSGAILFHSRETARLFFALPAIADNLTVLRSSIIACLSARVADVIPDLLQDRVKIAERPDEASLLALL